MKGKRIDYKLNQLHYIDLDSKFVILREIEEILIFHSTKSGKSNLKMMYNFLKEKPITAFLYVLHITKLVFSNTPFLGHHYYIHGLSDLFLGVEKTILKVI